MPSRRLRACVLFLLSACACASEPLSRNDDAQRTTPTAEPDSADVQTLIELSPEAGAATNTPNENHAYVWTKRDDAEEPESVEVDALTGREIAREPGIVIVAAGKKWRAEKQQHAVALASCKEMFAAQGIDNDFEDGEIQEAHTSRLVFRSDAGPDEQQLTAFDREEDLVGTVGAFDADDEITGSVGPFVFVKRTTYSFACGAHGSTTVESLVWDLEHGVPVNLAGELPVDPSLATEARAELGDEVFDLGEEPELTELVPRLTDDGRIVLDRQLTMGACYACSDGRWSSYSRSAILERASLPASLAAEAEVPVGVLAFRGTHPDLALAGFSAAR
jgi:hypothetical protein